MLWWEAPKEADAAGRGYHHGDLRRAHIEAALEAVTDVGAANVRLRDVARRAGVSHAAPAYHFSDKAGLLTAIAADGFELLADALTDTYARTTSLLEVGVAYVRFAVDHRPHFEVMFRPELYRADDPALTAPKAARGGGAVRTPRCRRRRRRHPRSAHPIRRCLVAGAPRGNAAAYRQPAGHPGP